MASSEDETKLAGPTPPRTPSGSALSSSGSIDHGRFQPGTILAERYRIIGRLGRGGMGEVYRADDLRLGQPVALKFLPASVERDPERLQQLQNEVRIARQVSHPNVCRVYDLADANGVHFLTMEFVDGEDLASLQRRIGRLPEDKALDLARQICAGVAAAHARDVLHRDLKPSNVMLDAEGRVRITDFGLAVAAGDVGRGLAGTPAYMAPEQLRGEPASVASDLFALGLVLYELVTGRRAFGAKTIDELKRQHHFRALAAPRDVVPSLNPAIERAILRCLEVDPADRPPSALAVAASLPGGDLLDLALARGETPSPAVVAASGGTSAAVTPAVGLACLGVVLLGLVASFTLSDRFRLIASVPFTLDPHTLADRARITEEALGAGAGAVARAWGLVVNADIQNWIWSKSDPGVRHVVLAANRPSPVIFWYRSSPRPLVPNDTDTPRASPGDPPVTVSGMTVVALDLRGRLMEFLAMPTQIESQTPPPEAPVDWSRFFGAAGLDLAQFQPITPDWTPRFYADVRMAWSGSAPELPGEPIRVEAASHRGRPVSFQLVGPWARPARMQSLPLNRATAIVTLVATVVIVPLFIVGGVLLARRNLRLGRGDRRGAFTLAAAALVLTLAQWLLGASHFVNVAVEQRRFAAAAANGLLLAAVYGLLYLAIEPQARRVWPHMLVTWSRLISGKIRDPRVGRDLLVGAAAGLVMTVLTLGHYALPGWFGWPEFRPAPTPLDRLVGAGPFVAGVVSALIDALQNALLGGVGLALLRLVARRKWIAYAVATAAFSFLAARGQFETGSVLIDLSLGAALVALVLWVVLRFGLVAGVVTFFVHFLTKDAPTTLDTSRPYFSFGLAAAVIVLAAAVVGFVFARAREPMFGTLDDL